jgi:flagellar hook-associated protein 1 FlgK
MGSSILNIGVTGLQVAQAGLLTSGHNIANAATPGFTRQAIVQTTNSPQFTGSGFLGQGANVESVRRIYSQFLSAQVLSAETTQAELDAYSLEIAQIDNLLADPNAGLSPALQDFFKSVSEVASNPSSIPARQAMLSGGQSLVGRFQDIDGRLGEILDGVNAQIQSTITGINSYTQQIAALNERIVLAKAGSLHQPPNDLLDQRDQLIADLNKQIRVTTITQSDGSLNVFIGNGQAVVVGQQSYALQAITALDDGQRVEVALVGPSGTPLRLPDTLLTGGTLGGLVAFRRESLDPTQNSLGRIAVVMAQTINDQHHLGQDLTGSLGGDFFRTPAPPEVVASSANTGTTAVVRASIADAAALQASDYRLLYNSTGNYTLTRLSDNVVVFQGASLPPAVDGMSIAVSGTLSANDSFLIRPVRAGARDIALAINDARNIAAAGPLRTRTSDANGGTAKITPGEVTTSLGLPLAGSITLTFDATGNRFVLSGAQTGTLAYNPATQGAGASFSVSAGGFAFSISGVPADGDRFVIEPNSAGVSDNRNALALGQLQTRNLVGGTASYQAAYSQTVSLVGSKARQVQVTLTAQENLVKQAQDARQSLSGVNLDEEAANLMRYQQAYQAAGKMIELAGRLFDEILAIAR